MLLETIGRLLSKSCIGQQRIVRGSLAARPVNIVSHNMYLNTERCSYL
jgi:hypothetical protein